MARSPHPAPVVIQARSNSAECSLRLYGGGTMSSRVGCHYRHYEHWSCELPVVFMRLSPVRSKVRLAARATERGGF